MKFRQFLDEFAVFYASIIKIGFIPYMPGTFGTIVAVFFYCFFISEKLSNSLNGLIILVIFTLFSQIFVTFAEKKLSKDDRRIIVDEFIGYLFAVMFLPKNMTVVIISFILFRFFDIVKPEPVNVLQKIPHGFGVSADDILAGIYTNLSIRIILFTINLI